MPDQNSPGSLVALLGNRQFAGSNRAGNLAKANGSSETPSRADFRRIPLSLPIKWTHSRGSQAEKKHLASVAAACVPEQEEEKPNKFCTSLFIHPAPFTSLASDSEANNCSRHLWRVFMEPWSPGCQATG